jgi:hypothetical protein
MNIFEQHMGVIEIIIFFVLIAFIVSCIQLSAIQHRLIKIHGWRFFSNGKARPLDIYWRDLSVLQRIRVWLGVVGFMLFLFCCAVSEIFK